MATTDGAGAAVRIEMSYDRLGSRLRTIGPVTINYNLMGARPSQVGSWTLSYDQLGSRLRTVGPYQLNYDRLGSRVSSVGAWTCDYDMLGARLRVLGPYQLTYDHLGSRIHTIGAMTLEYDRLGSRACAVELPPGAPALTDDDVFVIFLAHYLAERTRERSRS